VKKGFSTLMNGSETRLMDTEIANGQGHCRQIRRLLADTDTADGYGDCQPTGICRWIPRLPMDRDTAGGHGDS